MSSDGVGDFFAAEGGAVPALRWFADDVRGLAGAAVTFEFQALKQVKDRSAT